jgi:hypothetical protein
VSSEIWLYRVKLTSVKDCITGEVVGSCPVNIDDLRSRLMRDKGVKKSQKTKHEKWSKAIVSYTKISKAYGLIK